MNTFFVLFILSVSALTECLAADYGNLPYVVTSMDVTYPDEKKHPKRVEFASELSKKELKKYAEDKHEAHLITNVKFIEDKKIFQADIVDISEARGLCKKKPLFCIHGIDCSAEEHIDLISKNKDKHKKLLVVPVIWPILKQSFRNKHFTRGIGEGILIEYNLDKTTAEAAALAFREYMDKNADLDAIKLYETT